MTVAALSSSFDLELYDSSYADIEMRHDFFTAATGTSSKGVRVRVTGLANEQRWKTARAKDTDDKVEHIYPTNTNELVRKQSKKPLTKLRPISVERKLRPCKYTIFLNPHDQ
jgi:hypothetical protein